MLSCKTQNVNLIEALNFVFAGIPAVPKNKERVQELFYEDKTLRMKVASSFNHPKQTTRRVGAEDFEYLLSLEYHISDNRTVKGRF